MGLRKDVDDYLFKDEHCPGTEEAEPINIDISRYQFRRQIDFEKFVVDQFKRHDNKMSKLQKSFSELHRKMDYALMINAFGGTSKEDSRSEKDNADEKLLEMSDSEYGLRVIVLSL
ncbi:hypothetical protein V8G54_010459 [Vigna mungo]|uniref:Uncharacterized protein n=1 Tax=Vigna mungo TaxID=3915 RepID=A0AAQ3S4X0_VIGMU